MKNRKQLTCDYFLQLWRGLTQQFDELYLIFGDKASVMTIVYRWYGESTRSRSSLQDKFHEGHLKTVVFSRKPLMRCSN